MLEDQVVPSLPITKSSYFNIIPENRTLLSLKYIIPNNSSF